MSSSYEVLILVFEGWILMFYLSAVFLGLNAVQILINLLEKIR